MASIWDVVADCAHIEDIDERAAAVSERIAGDDQAAGELREAMRRAYDHRLWTAAIVMADHCGDDGFSDFRSWLVLQGRGAFEAATADPDSLANIAVRSPFTEVLGTNTYLDEPSGPRWTKAELADHLPRLVAWRESFRTTVTEAHLAARVGRDRLDRFVAYLQRALAERAESDVVTLPDGLGTITPGPRGPICRIGAELRETLKEGRLPSGESDAAAVYRAAVELVRESGGVEVEVLLPPLGRFVQHSKKWPLLLVLGAP